MDLVDWLTDITPIAIWFIISIVAWSLVGIAQGVLNTAILYKKNDREEDLTVNYRIAYLVSTVVTNYAIALKLQEAKSELVNRNQRLSDLVAVLFCSQRLVFGRSMVRSMIQL